MMPAESGELNLLEQALLERSQVELGRRQSNGYILRSFSEHGRGG